MLPTLPPGQAAHPHPRAGTEPLPITIPILILPTAKSSPSCSWPCQHCQAGRGNELSLGSHNLMEQQERQKKSNKNHYILYNTYMRTQTFPPLPSTSLTSPNDIFALQNCISDTRSRAPNWIWKNTAAVQMALKSTNKIIILMIFCG